MSVRRGVYESPIELARRRLMTYVDHGAGFEKAEIEAVGLLADPREALLPGEPRDDVGPERAVAYCASAAALRIQRQVFRHLRDFAERDRILV